MAESNGTSVATVERKSLVGTMASIYGMEPRSFMDTIKATVFPNGGQNVADSQVAAFLVVAHEHRLNPFTREIYAFPGKSGGIVPVVSVDGWLKLANEHPQFDGYEISVEKDKDDKIKSATITVYRKDRGHPTVHTELYSEAYRNTEPWNKMGFRMIINRVTVQGIRRAFGFAGIYEQDEAEMINITAESTVLERATETKTEQLKEKIGAKKAKKAEEAPVNPPPESPIEPSPFITEEQRQIFLRSLSETAKSIGATEQEALAFGKSLIAKLGVKNSREIPAEQFNYAMDSIQEWKK